jgi:hypothetical protein
VSRAALFDLVEGGQPRVVHHGPHGRLLTEQRGERRAGREGGLGLAIELYRVRALARTLAPLRCDEDGLHVGHTRALHGQLGRLDDRPGMFGVVWPEHRGVHRRDTTRSCDARPHFDLGAELPQRGEPRLVTVRDLRRSLLENLPAGVMSEVGGQAKSIVGERSSSQLLEQKQHLSRDVSGAGSSLQAASVAIHDILRQPFQLSRVAPREYLCA